MKWKAKLALGLVIAVAAYVIYDRSVIGPREALLLQTRTRLDEAARHIEAARLEAAESLLFQAGADLTTVDTWYALPSVRRRVKPLRLEVEAARERSNHCGKAIAGWFQALKVLIERGDNLRAMAQLTPPRVPLPTSDPRRKTLVLFIELLAARDFDGAERALASAPLGADGLRGWSSDLRELVQTRRSHETGVWLEAVRSLAEQGEFPQAAALALSPQSPLAASDPRRQAVVRLVGRLSVQDFAGAEQATSEVASAGLGASHEPFQQLIAAEREANHHKQALIAENVKPLIDRANLPRALNPELRGRAMVWDFTKEDVEKAYELLPDDLRASSRDGLITIFCVTERRNDVVGHYSISGQPAYREHMTLAVVYWPDGVAVGSTVITGGEPASVRVVKHTPEYGSSVKIKEWIERLPRAETHDGQSVRTAGSIPKDQATGSLFRNVAGWLKQGQVAKAREAIAGARSITSVVIPEPAVLAMSRFVDRMAVNDFVGAEAALGTLPRTSVAGDQIETETAALLRVVSERRQAVRADGAWIAERIKGLVSDRRRELRGRPPLRGRAMVWDFTKDDLEKAYELLPDDLRAQSRAGLLTVFCVTGRRNEVVGHYSISGQSAYKEHVSVAVVYWPAQRYLGTVEISGGDPASMRAVSNRPEYGSSVKVKEWIESLPKSDVDERAREFLGPVYAEWHRLMSEATRAAEQTPKARRDNTRTHYKATRQADLARRVRLSSKELQFLLQLGEEAGWTTEPDPAHPLLRGKALEELHHVLDEAWRQELAAEQAASGTR